MNFCLSDLVPPLRWSDAATIPLLRDQPDLPDAWWRSLPLAQVLTVLEPDRLAAILAGIALEHWPAAAVGDVLPALYVLDPDEADEPCTAIALDRTGSWPGLLALTGRELRDQPFIQPLPVLITLFAAVLGRVAHPFSPSPPQETETPGTAGGQGGEPAARKNPAAPAAPESAPDGSAPRDEGAMQAKAPKPAKIIKPAKPVRPAKTKGAAKSPAAPTAPTAPESRESPEPSGAPPGPAASPGPPERPADTGGTGGTGGTERPGDTEGSQRAEAPAEASGGARVAGVAKEPGSGGEDGGDEGDSGAGAAGRREVPEGSQVPGGGGAPAAGRKGPRPAADLHALLDAAFAGLDDRSWAVAQNRVFTDTPAAVEALAKLFAVGPETIREVEADLRRRLGEWLASDEATPYREHLAGLGRTLGKASPRARLIAAAPWHARELPSLDVPAWHFVLATLSGYHLTGEWLVEGDITELRRRTRDVISGAKPPLTMSKALDLVVSLGIRPEVSKEWLENVPQLRILAAGRPSQGGDGAAAPPTPPGSPAATGEAGRTDGTGGTEGGPGAPGAPFRPLKDVSLTRRCFRQPDGRWWLRIDVTDEHIRGAECALPTGFAAYLGMSPGNGRKVQSAVGEMTLHWHERPALESLKTLLEDAGAKRGSHLFLTLSDEGVLRARHLPAAGKEVEAISQALRLVGYTAPGGTPEQAGRVIATRVGMNGPVGLPDLLIRLRERGDRDLLSLLA